ncbi:hypothetical protein IRY55_13225 [Savagea sp. SN6]|uniref:Uncharacterized protein n=1 Tax=Savagea serpentis TaxID=2785297 RepID=A0A8J7G8W4_9BACL|nr:hypothetical protein [Savagea serpentis]MBF4502321.1 hypothetical protein [Savagea serpentis]
MSKQKINGLIKKKVKNTTLKPSVPIKKIQDDDFGYSIQRNSPLLHKKESSGQKQFHVSAANLSNRSPLTKENGKSIKITKEVLDEIQLLGSFINESVIYKIIGELLDSYIQNELSERQQRQFEFILRKNTDISS